MALPDRLTPPLTGSQFRWTVGVHPVKESQWLAEDAPDTGPQLRAKYRLHRDQLDQVVQQLPNASDLGERLLALVLDWLSSHSATHQITNGSVFDTRTGHQVELLGASAMATVGRLVPEDFVVMNRDGEHWIMAGGSVCFPSRWKLTDKIGETLSAIHQPVPGYHQTLDRPVNLLFDRLGTDEIKRRTSWTLTDSGELHLSEPATTPAEPRFVRFESQSFRRLPGTSAIVFTIRTAIETIAELSATERERLRAMANKASPDIRRYRNWPSPR